MPLQGWSCSGRVEGTLVSYGEWLRETEIAQRGEEGAPAIR